jgi:hypothetical protein
MTSGAVLLVAIVVAAQGQTAQVDLGYEDGLIEGVEGRAYYELTVGGEPKRIEVGRATVSGVKASAAMVQIASSRSVYPGQRVEFEIAKASDAAEPEPVPAPILVTESVADSTAPIAKLESSPQVGFPEVDAEVEDVVIEQRMEANPSRAQQKPTSIAAVTVQGDSYWIGLDQAETEFFNQTPRFSTEVPSFRIDLRPVADQTASTLHGLNYAEAQLHCAARGARLPTEVEWEIAAAKGQLEVEPGLLEWTASWYQAYPGNRKQEPEYGQRFRVLRGSLSGRAIDQHDRRFLDPGQRNGQVGFRCVEENR